MMFRSRKYVFFVFRDNTECELPSSRKGRCDELETIYRETIIADLHHTQSDNHERLIGLDREPRNVSFRVPGRAGVNELETIYRETVIASLRFFRPTS
ncbi:unnamed protein product [Dovyalis caffra]|uniref:Uncharacterized protein n=1 Tax=Dovyalis caffra TaxID=77055 RepID=A0AAV1QQI3_9ROSI|nr:unnamed protein product [Dovyalis caffra]